MKKNLLALLCVLSILVGVFAVTATAETTAEDTFQVGYARVDINPYYRDDDGNLTDAEGNLLAEGENGVIMPVPLRGRGTSTDRLATGKMDDNGDGEVDANDGLFATCIAISDSKENTVLLITMDAIGDMGHSKLAREEICNRISGMTPDRIMISGTHAHGGVDLEANTSNLEDAVKTNLATWKTQLIDYLADAAEAAIADQKPATVKKGEIEATEKSEAATGSYKLMNSMRNYYVEDEKMLGLYTNKYVISDVYYPAAETGDYKNSVSEVDQTLHLISFEFAEEDERLPIVLTNWRCHPSLNGQKTTDENYYKVTSDYVNAFRYELEHNEDGEQVYRSAFFQGAGGNSNPASKVGSELDSDGNSWITSGNVYGEALAQIAEYALNNGYVAQVGAGDIKTVQKVYQAKSIVYTADEIAAATAAVGNTSWPYTASNGVILASSTQRDRILKYQNNDENSTTKMEINALLIGPNIAIVTTPGEAFDRYSSQVSWQDIKDQNWDKINSFNDWDKLNTYNANTGLGIENALYEEPLIFGYSNLHVTYIPNSLAYEYNSTEIEGDFGVGSYETHMTPLAKGEGEIMVAKLEGMLVDLVDQTKKDCPACGKEVSWLPMDSETVTEGGHYYLTDDVDIAAQKELKYATTLCIDLNGHKLTSAGRAFYTYADVTLNIMDSGESGQIVGTGTGSSGGTLYVNAGSTVNICDSQISCDTATTNAANGGVIWSKGIVTIRDSEILGGKANNNGGTIYVAESGQVDIHNGNVYGGEAGGTGGTIHVQDSVVLNLHSGTIYGGKSTGKGGTIYGANRVQINVYDGEVRGGETDSNGGTVCLNNSNCYLNAYGGSILAGTAKGAGNCVSIDYGKVTMAGDADVAEIRYAAVPSSTSFKIVKPADNALFSGQVVLNTPSIAEGTVIGTSAVEWAAGSKVTISDGTEVVMTKEKNLVAVAKVCDVAAVVDGDSVTAYPTLEAAIANVGGGYVVLGTDVEKLTVSNDVIVDLNGKSIGTLELNDGATFYIRDRKTDDYYIGDHVYGVIKEVTGDGVVMGDDSYLEITDSEGTSAHCYNIELESVVLSPSKTGIYYKSNSLGDSMVAQQIGSFGTALKISKVPYITENTDEDTYSVFTADKFGGENTSTTLAGIMKSTNSPVVNATNAQQKVYGRSYIKLLDGSYRYCVDVAYYSLQELTQEADAKYDNWDNWEQNAEQKALVDMYGAFSAVMKEWEMIPNIKEAYAQKMAQEEATEVATLKVLVLGSELPADSSAIIEHIQAAGVSMDGITSQQVGVLWNEGYGMAEHAANTKNAVYNYATLGSDATQENKSLEEVLEAEQWDVIVLPETSGTDAQRVKNFVKRTLLYTPVFVQNAG